MNAENALATIAQIGVALAGFAGIVGALAGERLRPTHPEVWYPFWALISSGLCVVFVALFPFLLHYFRAPEMVAAKQYSEDFCAWLKENVLHS